MAPATESSELFAKVFQAISEALAVSDLLTGEVLEINEAFEQLFGYSREEIIGRTSLELGVLSNEQLERLIAEAVRHGGSVRDFRSELRVKSGERRACLISADAVEIGGRVRLVVLARDITSRALAERALRESEERFVKAFGASPNAIAISELPSGRLLEVNDSYVRLSGMSREQLIGHAAADLGLWPGIDRAELAMRLSRDGSFRELEARTTNGRGEPLVAMLAAEVIEIRGERCIIMTAQDVTERRRIEEAKARLEAELRHAQRLDAIGTLAGGIAHDFNNILGAILAFTELARLDSEGNGAVIEHLNEVTRASERAKELVRQILTFSRRQPTERRTIQLRPVVKEVLSLVRSTLPSTIEIASEISGEVAHVHADASQIHQVLLNLCTNAAHAMRERAGRLSVRLLQYTLSSEGARGRGLAPGDYVRLSVEDTGCGMDAETQKRIFEPFFTTKQQGEGSGLGLSVVHGIIQDHEGAIWVESEPGRGTTVHVILPARVVEPAAKSLRPEETPRGRSERVLLIDDELVLCRAAKRILERLNYVVTAETDAPRALSLFRSDPMAFDLVITDLTMPAITGVELASQLLLVRADIPIVLLTGFSANLSAESVEALGIRQLALKPLSASALARTVRAALSKS
jgi:PAS domain S-box-containing protein